MPSIHTKQYTDENEENFTGHSNLSSKGNSICRPEFLSSEASLFNIIDTSIKLKQPEDNSNVKSDSLLTVNEFLIQWANNLDSVIDSVSEQNNSIEALANDSLTNIYSLNHLMGQVKQQISEKEYSERMHYEHRVQELSQKIKDLESSLAEYSLLYKVCLS